MRPVPRPIHVPSPSVGYLHAREEMARSLLGTAPAWPDGTPRWMPYTPKTEEGLTNDRS